MKGFTRRIHVVVWLFVAGASMHQAVLAQEPLFRVLGLPEAHDLPEHAVAGQGVSLNPRAFESPQLSIELFGEVYDAVRIRTERGRAGEVVWIGHLEGNPLDSVILTRRGNQHSGFIQYGLETYRITAGTGSDNRLLMLDLQQLPADDVFDSPLGATASEPAMTTASDPVVQDLLVVYTAGACVSAGGCAQLEADIVTAVADMNAAYAASGIDITINLAGTHQTSYTGTDASQTLSDLRGTSDGQMDEVHGVRDALGADIVSLIYDGQGCGIGYLSSSASTAFNVTDEPCLVGNRTMAHEIGHNQGAHHDRVTAGAGTSSNYNYGYRRCNDTSVDGFGSPYFRTVLSYSCAGAPRVGRFSNPYVSYLGVPQGVDPAVVPGKGAWNARTLNERATYVASFRAGTSTPPPTPPSAPASLGATATGSATIDVDWLDNSGDESTFTLQRSPNGSSSWSTIATLAANTVAWTDTGLAPESTHHYRVRANNDAGSSAWSNVANATTSALPAEIEDVALGELSMSGSASGTYIATHADDGSAQVITETSSGGPKRSRSQSYRHAWTFDVVGGAGGVILTMDAWVSGSEAANVYYSLDGGASRSFMFTVDHASSTSPQMFALPGNTAGPVRIEIESAEQMSGEGVDSVSIDHIVITSYTEAGNPPAAPADMAVIDTTASSVSVAFTDAASDEFGFELRRATTNPAGNCSAGAVVAMLSANPGTGTVSHTDETASPATTYWYWASAFNGAGEGGCSNAATGTTAFAPAIGLSVSGGKQKGVMQVDLSWNGATSTNVDIWRNGTLQATTSNDGSWFDDTGLKGSATWTYQVCHAGTTVCSNEAVAAF